LSECLMAAKRPIAKAKAFGNQSNTTTLKFYDYPK